jgi:anti-anti-sigma factor
MGNPIERSLGDDGVARVVLLGEIDYANSDEVAQELRDAVSDWSPAEVRVDLEDATFIDSTGLGALIEGYQAATEGDCAFVVINPSVSFRRVLTVTGLCEVFGMAEDISQQTSSGVATG